jgi:hypothetical protein
MPASTSRKIFCSLSSVLFGAVLILACLACPSRVPAQTELAGVYGRVTDPSGAVIVDAEVEIKNVETNVSVAVKTNQDGLYTIPSVHPGHYLLNVRKPGFKSVTVTELTLNVQDNVVRNFALQVGSIAETVTITADSLNINTTDATVSTVVDRQFAENLPLNGRSFQTLIQLTPGVVLTAYSNHDNGQFSVNGQRAASNYWMVDGVSANVGIGTSAFATGNGVAGANASLSVLGGTNSLVSVDALQEFRIQTSTYAPEFGRTPGGQISIVTRSGTNQWHGSAFEYLRNDLFDANDWFANANKLAKPQERQNDFGGTFSGPIFKERTFFFFSYEGLRLRLPQVAESLVPDVNARQSAVASMQPFLNAFPVPNGTDNTTTEIAHFNASYSNRATLDAYSLRVDHKLGRNLSIFGRYNYSPSTSIQRGVNLGSLNSVTSSEIKLQTATVGLTWTVSSNTVNDLRFNYSRTNSSSHISLDAFGGAVPLASLPFPNGFTADNANALLLWLPLSTGSNSPVGLVPGFQGKNLQRQINIVDNVSVQKGSHSLKFGIDWRRLSPDFGNPAYRQEAIFLSVPASVNGNAFFSQISSGRTGEFFFHNLGAFAQDTWRATPRFTLTYGLRWDLDFAPSANPALLAVTGFNLNDLSNLALAPAGTPPFHTTYGNVAPRIGVAYHIAGNQNWQTVLRGGFGVFYDLATSEVGNIIASNQYPFGASRNVIGATFPLSDTNSAAPAITAASLSRPGGLLNAFDPNLKLPYALEWNVALEQALGAQQTLSATYVGSSGRRLMQTAFITSPNTNFFAANLATNEASSNYNALQVQFQRRLSRGLQALASYSWAHSIDTASAGSLFGNEANALTPGVINNNRGASDFDVRHDFSTGLTYAIPSPKLNVFTNTILAGWSVESVVQARSALPLTVIDGLFTPINHNEISVRADVVPGIPLYLYGPQYPGGKALNNTPDQGGPGCLGPFCPPPKGSQGNLSRNALRGFEAWQWDFAVHRDFPIREFLKLQFRAEMFNVLNHPNFAPPVSDITNRTQFGLSTQTLGNYLAGANIGSGAFNPLYQIGGPRSVQFALKLQF